MGPPIVQQLYHPNDLISLKIRVTSPIVIAYSYNVGKTIINHPPNHHFQRWYVYHSQMDSLWHCFNHITIVFRWYKRHYYCLLLLYQQKSYRSTSYRYHYRYIPIVIRISYITTVVIYLYNWNHYNWQLAPNPSSPSRFPGFLSEGPASHWVPVMRVKMTKVTSPAMYSIYI